MASIQKRPDGKWRARYRDEAGKEHARHFPRKVDAQRWLDGVTASVVTGTYVDPKHAKLTVAEWADIWLAGYGTRAPSTVRQARHHLKVIKEDLGSVPLASLRPSDVRNWTTKLAQTRAKSTTYALYARLAQLMADAVHDGIIPRSPCSRRTSPGMAEQRPFVASTAQVWAIHDAFPEHLRPAVLLGAFAGLRVSEVAGLRVQDVDFMRGVISPQVQYPEKPLKTKASMQPIPIPQDLALQLAAAVQRHGGECIITNAWGSRAAPHVIEAAMRVAKEKVEPDDKLSLEALPEGFRFHDLRHYFASMLIASGLDVKVVQAMLRHGSAKTTLDTYGHMFPDKQESARSAIASAMASRADSLRTNPAQTLSDKG